MNLGACIEMSREDQLKEEWNLVAKDCVSSNS